MSSFLNLVQKLLSVFHKKLEHFFKFKINSCKWRFFSCDNLLALFRCGRPMIYDLKSFLEGYEIPMDSSSD